MRQHGERMDAHIKNSLVVSVYNYLFLKHFCAFGFDVTLQCAAEYTHALSQAHITTVMV
jgi:hypothetical protein